jgi:hypothetical protein
VVFPLDQAGPLPASLLTKIAEDGAVIGRSCVSQVRTQWSVLLTLRNNPVVSLLLDGSKKPLFRIRLVAERLD